MKINSHRIYVLFASLLFASGLFAQENGAIKGTITDMGMNQEPVLFANVSIKNTGTAIETNFHGNYEFNDVTPGEYTLVISYLGYETTEVPIVVTANNVTKVSTGIAALVPSFEELELGDEALHENKVGTSATRAEPPRK